MIDAIARTRFHHFGHRAASSHARRGVETVAPLTPWNEPTIPTLRRGATGSNWAAVRLL